MGNIEREALAEYKMRYNTMASVDKKIIARLTILIEHEPRKKSHRQGMA